MRRSERRILENNGTNPFAERSENIYNFFLLNLQILESGSIIIFIIIIYL